MAKHTGEMPFSTRSLESFRRDSLDDRPLSNLPSMTIRIPKKSPTRMSGRSLVLRAIALRIVSGTESIPLCSRSSANTTLSTSSRKSTLGMKIAGLYGTARWITKEGARFSAPLLRRVGEQYTHNWNTHLEIPDSRLRPGWLPKRETRTWDTLFLKHAFENERIPHGGAVRNDKLLGCVEGENVEGGVSRQERRAGVSALHGLCSRLENEQIPHDGAVSERQLLGCVERVCCVG